MSEKSMSLSTMIDIQLAATKIQLQKERERQQRIMQLTQSQKPTATEIGIYGESLRKYFNERKG